MPASVESVAGGARRRGVYQCRPDHVERGRERYIGKFKFAAGLNRQTGHADESRCTTALPASPSRHR